MTRLAHSGCVDERGELLDVVCEQTVEEVHVGIPQNREVLVLLNGRSPRSKNSQASLGLVLEGLDGRWSQTIGSQVLSRLLGVGGVIVGGSWDGPSLWVMRVRSRLLDIRLWCEATLSSSHGCGGGGGEES